MLHEQIEEQLQQQQNWALRRQLGIPNNRRLFVLACMDERLPVNEALGIEEGDAHVFRNAGGLVTDDAIRSAMLTTRFFGTEEIVIVLHTECGMMSASTETIVDGLKQQGVDTSNGQVDPALSELSLAEGSFGKWIKMFHSVDETCARQVELFRSSPLIPDNVTIHGYVYEVETGQLRRPHHRLGARVNTAEEMRAGKA